jgi:hypothetical protein
MRRNAAMTEYYRTIYAINAIPDKWRDEVLDSLKSGIGRFGWSSKIASNLLTEEYHEEKRANRFLLNLMPGDYVVYINMPLYGQCTLAKLTGRYYFQEPMGEDFNHCFCVDPESVRTFERNDSSRVQNLLSSRLKLQNRYWRIYCQEEFQYLLDRIDKPESPENQAGDETDPGIEYFMNSINGELSGITEKIHKHHPNFALEKLMCRVFRNTGKYDSVEHMQGRNDLGADIVLTCCSADFPGISEQRKCLVQVKSYGGEMSNSKALEGLRKAFAASVNEDASSGLIISTANAVSENFEKGLDVLREETGKPIAVLYGAELAKYVMRYL